MSEKKRRIVTVTAQCVVCKHRREIKAGEVPLGGLPECDKCHSVMVAVKASGR